MTQAPGKLIKTLLPVIVFGVLGGIAWLITANPPEPARRAPGNGGVLVVEATQLRSQDYQIQLQSYGTVQPRTRSRLVSQVSGQIVSVNDAFRDGGFFELGDELLSIDPRDYQADVKIAMAALLDAKQMLVEAQARSEQANRDWQRLGNIGEPPPLVLRTPQLEAARARVASAEAGVRKAQLDLERTTIKAPFAGRVLTQNADIGQVVSANTQLGEIYSTDVIEIRLPLRNTDLNFVDLPERSRFADTVEPALVDVELRSELNTDQTWDAKLVRTEGAIDISSRQLHVVAQIKDPYGAGANDRTPLKIGQYVTAQIAGKTISNALVIPNETIYQGSYVYTVLDGALVRREISITWQNDVEALVNSGLNAGDFLVTTSLGQVASGTRVSIAGAQQRDRRAGEPRKPGAERAAGDRPNRQNGESQ